MSCTTGAAAVAVAVTSDAEVSVENLLAGLAGRPLPFAVRLPKVHD